MCAWRLRLSCGVGSHAHCVPDPIAHGGIAAFEAGIVGAAVREVEQHRGFVKQIGEGLDLGHGLALLSPQAARSSSDSFSNMQDG